MRVLAYCTYRSREAVGRAVGVVPITSPPYSAADAGLASAFAGREFIYIRLHGMAQSDGVWYGEDHLGRYVPALSESDLRCLRLARPVVLLANCYGATDPMVQALYDAGAAAVIAAPGLNYAHGVVVMGADVLARWLLAGLRFGLGLYEALWLAKWRLRLTARWSLADRDALGFEVLHRGSAV